MIFPPLADRYIKLLNFIRLLLVVFYCPYIYKYQNLRIYLPKISFLRVFLHLLLLKSSNLSANNSFLLHIEILKNGFLSVGTPFFSENPADRNSEKP